MASSKAKLPLAIKPMLGRLTRQPFDSPDFIYELKWDGWRALAFIEDGTFRLVSRNGKDMTAQFPELSDIVSHIKTGPAVLDGEIVCLDENNRPSFNRLQQRMQTKKPAVRRTHPVNFIAFDLLYDKGRSVMNEPLLNRKKRLSELLEPTELAQVSEFVETDGTAFFQATCDLGLEGIMAKEKHSLYLPGQRTPHWLKVKRVRESEFVIGGYSFGGARKELFSSLLLGLYDNDQCFTYVGSVGTGFSEAEAKTIYAELKSLHVEERSFVNTPDVKRLIHWCRPQLVCQVEYGEFTIDGKLRYPIFLRLRDDKSPTDCTQSDAQGWPRADAIMA
jgi:DNA ligase D-like protein (predicted ligase)